MYLQSMFAILGFSMPDAAAFYAWVSYDFLCLYRSPHWSNYHSICEVVPTDEVACIMVNHGGSDFYTDRDGNIFPNHEGFIKGAE